jgi:hypothetical protein
MNDGTRTEDQVIQTQNGDLGDPRPCVKHQREHRAITLSGPGGSAEPYGWLARLPCSNAPTASGLIVHVHHYPPGTSKWNRIEHRLFCHITQNWRGRPLTDRLAVVELIGATTTRTGLKVECAIDANTYEKGVKVSDERHLQEPGQPEPILTPASMGCKPI